MKKLDRDITTRESILYINNTEHAYYAFKSCSTITELGELFMIYVAPHVRKYMQQPCYTLHDIELGELLDNIETNI